MWLLQSGNSTPMTTTKTIHIQWDGPIPLNRISEFKTEKDYGIYQIYGGHVIYGGDVLLYIGKAGAQHFGTRIPQEKWWPEHQDAERLRIYIGRLAGEITPDDATWGKQIDYAERLLISACSPAYNAQKNLGCLEPDLRDVHVFNWGFFADLLPEVSGLRWTSRFDIMPNYHVFDTTDPRS
jgi:hypothetical protein